MAESVEVRTMRAERSKASFPVDEMSNLLWGGPERRARMEELRTAFSEDPVFRKDDRIFMNHQQAYKRSLEKMAHFHKKMLEMGITKEDEATWCYRGLDELIPSETHLSMFLPAMRSQTSPEQRAKWLPLAESFAIIGAYAQTELAHGSNVRGLETTATYLPDTQEFEIHSPTLGSTKWWPGGLGLTATHALVAARLITKGQDHGVHNFIVPLRDSEHKPLPGVELGDIGPKVGFNTLDNGFALFTRVRIPRVNMLMRYSRVEPDGTYVPPAHAKVGYGPMMHVRANIVSYAASALARALTIAIRFSAVRRQGSRDPATGLERQVLDYTSQQWALLPLLATSYAMLFTGRAMRALYSGLQQTMQADDMTMLPEVHATSAGLKALVTLVTADGIEQCRKLCGGHGYSQFSGLPETLANYLATCTVEGTAEVLGQQTARYILKALVSVRKGKPVGLHCAYLTHFAKLSSLKCSVRTLADCDSFAVLEQLYDARALRLALAAEAALAANAVHGPDQAWNASLVSLLALSRAHCQAFVVRTFLRALTTDTIAAPLKPVLTRLALLHAIRGILADAGEFFHSGILTSDQHDLFHERALLLLAEIRPDAVALVDAWAYSDTLLNSALGMRDGDIYRHLFVAARTREPLNRSPIPDGYHEYIKPMLEGGARHVAALAKAKL
eukprot:m.112115 g.112115  ORF g.112115 m.112115 type:complete len:674 (+) comp14366_c5_seq1:2732-4753(+)